MNTDLELKTEPVMKAFAELDAVTNRLAVLDTTVLNGAFNQKQSVGIVQTSTVRLGTVDHEDSSSLRCVATTKFLHRVDCSMSLHSSIFLAARLHGSMSQKVLIKR